MLDNNAEKTGTRETGDRILSGHATARRRLSTIVVLVVTGVTLSAAAALWLRARWSTQKSPDLSAEEAEAADVITLSDELQRNAGLLFEPAQIKTIVQTIQATGAVGPNEARVAHIRPLATGRIERVHVRAGDRVSKGQPLVDYDNIELGELIGQYLSALAAVDKANAEAEVRRRSVERAKRLVDLGAVAKAEYEKRNADHQNALATINSQKAEVDKVEEKIHRFGLTDADLEKLRTSSHAERHRYGSHSVLAAPFAGVVIKSEAAEGEVVDTERELFTIADISTVWVQADVYEKDIASIRQGQEAKISVAAYPEEEFTGKITYVTDFLDPKTRTAKVRCEVTNPRSRLKLEMFARIQIPTPAQREALMIPTSAVQQIQDKPVVFVRRGDAEFEKREVQLGPQSDGWVEVTAGLNSGEVVVTQGSFYLKSAVLKDQISGED
jgi:cobalt-zinc-cadmium efflux system membrane fusion protein